MLGGARFSPPPSPSLFRSKDWISDVLKLTWVSDQGQANNKCKINESKIRIDEGLK